MKQLFLIGSLFLVISAGCQADGRNAADTIPTDTPTPTAGKQVPTMIPTENQDLFFPPEPTPCNDDSCLQSCLNRLGKVLKTQDFQPLTTYAGTGAHINMVEYEVQDGRLGKPQLLYVPDDFKKYQQDYAAQQRIWDYAARLLPAFQLHWITKYLVFTDGPRNYVAWADFDRLDHRKWTLSVDIVDSGDSVILTWTLVHEFGHLITMNTDQVPQSEYAYGWYQNSAVCPQFSDNVGCTKPESYMNLFYQEFWKDMYQEWMETVKPQLVNTDEELRALAELFYSNHADLFVRDYAATNIHEDMAESFSQFVMAPKPLNDSVINRKILFYYDFPELVQLRQQMIQGICNYAPGK